jgi:GntR family transcriptional regulator
MKPGSIVLGREVVQASDHVASALNLSEGEQVNMLYRLRFADEVPMAIQTSYTPYRLFPELLEGPWTLDTSLYETLSNKYGISITLARQTIRGSLITPEQSQLLQVKAGSPALELDTIAYTAEGMPVEYGLDIYRADRYQYSVTLQKRI